MTDSPLLTPQRTPEGADAALRPKTLAQFVGLPTANERPHLAAAPGASIVPS